MSLLVNAVVLSSLLVSLQAALPSASFAAEPPSGQQGGDRWVPSLAITSGLTIQNWEGAVASQACSGCSIPDPAMEALRPADADSDLDVTPPLSGSFELMTPEIAIPTSPRFFVGGEIGAAFGTERRLAGEGDPGTLTSPLPDAAASTTPFGENSVLGQGSQTLAELTGPVFGAYAGVAFPLEFNGRPMRIRASVAWIRYDVDVQGLVVDAQCTSQCNTTVGPFGIIPGFLREVRLAGSGSDTFNGIGPGLDFEMDTGRAGPIGTSLFFGARLYRMLGNQKIEFSDSQSFSDVLGDDEAAARWSFEVDDWMYRVGIGMRFQWLGSDR